MERSRKLRKAIKDFVNGVNGFSDAFTPTEDDRERLAIRVEEIFMGCVDEN